MPLDNESEKTRQALITSETGTPEDSFQLLSRSLDIGFD